MRLSPYQVLEPHVLLVFDPKSFIFLSMLSIDVLPLVCLLDVNWQQQCNGKRSPRTRHALIPPNYHARRPRSFSGPTSPTDNKRPRTQGATIAIQKSSSTKNLQCLVLCVPNQRTTPVLQPHERIILFQMTEAEILSSLAMKRPTLAVVPTFPYKALLNSGSRSGSRKLY